MAGLGLTACGPKHAAGLAASAQQQTPQNQLKSDQLASDDSQATHINDRPEGTQFSDVLKEYKNFNDRINRLQAPLRLTNTQLCPKTERDPGFITHKLEDYPPHMQMMAQEFLGLSGTGIFIRSVRRGSPAEDAQIREGDEIIAINERRIAGGATQSRFYKALARNAFNGVQTRMTLKSQQGQSYETKLRAQTACNIPASVIFSEDINGHTDGSEIFVTSALMNSVGDDVNLSLVLAHEMSHVIAGHAEFTPSAKLELEADRMALVLMHNAGLDIDNAIDFWREASHPHLTLQNTSATHPSITARYENFLAERKRIKKQISKGSKLTFK